MTTEIQTPDYADFKVWAACLKLKIDDITAMLTYAQATDYCSNCPGKVDDDHPNVGGVCCRETGEWDERYLADEEYIRKLRAARAALRALIPDGE